MGESTRTIAWWLFGLTLALGAAFPYFSSFMNANERPRILQAIAWVDTGELAVDGVGARGIDPGIDVARSPVDGRLYPNKPPGATIPAVAGYALVRARGYPIALADVTRAARWLGGLLPTLLLCGVLLLRYVRRSEPRLVIAAVVLYAVATPVASYARLLFGHQLTACLLTIGTLFVVDATDRDRPRRSAIVRAAIGGLLAAAAITVEYTAAFAGLPIGVFLLLRARRDRRLDVLAAALVGAFVPIALLGWYHTAVFGAPLTTPYHFVVEPSFATIHARGLLGLGMPSAASAWQHLASPWGGLLYWAPLVAIAFAYGLRRWRSLDAFARLGLAIFATLLVVNLGLLQTGGWRIGPRYLVAAFAFVIPALVELLARARTHRLFGPLLVGLAVWSTAINALASHLFPHVPPQGNPLADLLLPLLLDGHAPYNVLAPIVGGERPALAIVLGTMIGLVALATWRLGWTGRERGVALTLGTIGGILFVGAALAVPSAPRAEADLAAIAAIWEPRPGGNRITIEIGPVSPGSRL